MTEEEREARIAQLKAKLRARDGRPGYKINCEELRAEIARLEATDA
jgi:hypothetical protein